MTDLSVATFSSDLSAFVNARDIPEDTLDSFIVSLGFVYRELIVLETTSSLSDTQLEVIAIVRCCLSTLNSTYEQRTLFESGNFQVQPLQTGLVGRPSFLVSSGQLSFSLRLDFLYLNLLT